MPPRTRRSLVLAGAALAVLAGAILFRGLSGRGVVPAGSVGRTTGGAAERGSTNSAADAGRPAGSRDIVVNVDVEALKLPRPEPVDTTRDPFRFRPKAPPPGPPAAARAGAGASPGASIPSSPPPLPPIALKFIGVVDAPGQAGRLAVLSDGRGVYQGREGETIEGRYRIIKIGVESVELAYADGRGRQTIRLTGQ